ncbi:hypothetical protein ISG33_15220 [Glaciecola sp. MH2013]|uniref:hypothetical protein n=1 Tax=Glaciecola sp. MH2013 TaxID=2785524 RepID=UPI00189E3AE2|nr:hypothetical protein [Glaciecola sp. MH2013]MBF7074757.1 hypothetical protein [Glaciecola sp. MH2013]
MLKIKVLSIFILFFSVFTKASEHISLTLDLQSGFTGQDVEIFINDIKVLELTEIESDPVLDLAHSFKTEIKERGYVTVKVLAGDSKTEICIEVTEEQYLGIERSINGKLVHTLSSHPFLYD